MNLIFMGTPLFAATALGALLAAGHRVLAVYTQPPRPAGRGHRVQLSAVHELAHERGLDVRCPARLRDEAVESQFAALAADVAVVAAYGLILPRAMLGSPRLGCLNVHASLLPRWRGAAPVQRALLAGDAETGVTIMQMEEGLDTGAILMQRALPIQPGTTATALTAALAQLGSELIVSTLKGAAKGTLRSRPQAQEGATYAPKVRREEGRLDWRQSAEQLERRLRALEPWPGVSFQYLGEQIRVLAAEALPNAFDIAPGTVLDDRLSVACGSGMLRLLRLQRPGRGPLDAAAFLRGYPIAPGILLPCPATS